MWLSRKKKQIDALHDTVKNLVDSINANIKNDSLEIDQDYFALAKKKLIDIRNDLQSNNFKRCIVACNDVKNAVDKELEIIHLFNETKALIGKKKPGSLYSDAVFHQKEAVAFIKKGLLSEAYEEIKKAKIAAEPTVDFLVNRLQHAFLDGVMKYKNKEYPAALQEFIQLKNRFAELHTLAKQQGETTLIDTITSSITELERYIQDIEKIQEGEAYEKTGRLQEALESYETSVMINPKSFSGWTHQAEIYFSLSDFNKAIEKYNKVLEQEPRNPDILYKKALALFKNGENERSFSTCAECLTIDPDYSPAHTLREQLIYPLNQTAEKLYIEKKYDAAIELFDKILKIDPFNVMILSRKGETYREMQDVDSALRSFVMALSKDSEYFLAKKGLEEITNSTYDKIEKLREGKNYNKAIDLSDKILQYVPSETRFWYSKALCLESLNKIKSAFESISKAVEQKPDSIEYLKRKMSYLVELHQDDKALEIIDLLIQQNPTDVEIYLLKSSLLWRNQKKVDALDCIYIGLQKNPGNIRLQKEKENIFTKLHDEIRNSFNSRDFKNVQPQLNILLNNEKSTIINLLKDEAEKSFNENDFRKAFFQFTQIYEIEPLDIHVIFRIALILGSFKEYEKALTYLVNIPSGHQLFESGQSEQREILSSLLYKARSCTTNKNFEEALSIYDVVIKYDPRNGLAYIEKGIVLIELGRSDDAVEHFTTALNLLPNDVLLPDYLGNLLFQLKRYSEALPHLTHYLDLNRDEDEIWYKKGKSHQYLNQNQKAIDSYDKAIKINPKNANYWSARASVLEILDKNEDALNNYDRAIEINPKNDSLWNNRGFVLNKLHRYQEAISAYEKAQELAPQNETILNNIEQLTQDLIQPCKELFGNKQYEETINLSSFILKHDTENEEIIRIKAYSVFKTEQYKKSITVFNHLLKLNPTNDHDWYTIGKAYGEIDDLEKALDCFSMALKINDNNIDASTEKNSIKGKLRIKKDNQKYIEQAKEWYDNKSYSRALEYINKAFLNSPENPIIIDLKNKILKKISNEGVSQSKKYLSEGD
jgi:tetratricopeptide (TPR) repeat protein